MKRYLPVLVLIALLVPVLAQAGPVNGELTFSAAAFKPNDGGTSWSATGEYLIPLAGGPLLFGPSVSIFDGPGFDGGEFGVAGEVNFGKKCGPGFGGALHRPFGDAADSADYTGEVRAFFKCGTEHAFVKFTGAQTWSKAADGAVTDPDGTSFLGGVGWRF